MPVNKQHLAIGVDAGSAFTRCVIFEFYDGLLRYLGHGEIESAGWNKGRLTDNVAVQICIRSAIEHAESIAHVPVDAVVLGIGGPSIDGANNRGLYEFGRPRRVTASEVTFAIERASKVRLEDDRMILEMLPQDFTIDGRAGYRQAIGSQCTRLEANVYLITASQREHDMMIMAAHRAHIGVEETVFEPVAAAYAAILPEERSRGVALVDIGWHSTGLVVYDGDAVVVAKSLPICADHFTRDVAQGLKVNYEDAERLKIEYGCAILGLTADNSLIEIPSPEGRAPREAPRRQLNEILEARAEELFFYIRNELTQVGMEQSLLEGVVLVGGGALLNGMCDMAERVLNCPARNGLLLGVEGWPEELKHPAWTTAGGLAMYSARLKLKQDTQRKAPGLMGLILR
jgi:cell division protein FtsA